MSLLQIEKIVLASTSPFRQQLMRDAGLSFIALSPEGVDETVIQGSNSKHTALLRAQAKAEAVQDSLLRQNERSFVVIACDQVLDFGGQSLGKAQNAVEAKARLQAMSGKSHYLHNGMAILAVDAAQNKQVWSLDCSSVTLHMRSLTMEEIDSYVASEEWKGSAGAYKIEGRGLFLFESIEGLQADIIGLPLLRMFAVFKDHGFNLLLHPPWDKPGLNCS